MEGVSEDNSWDNYVMEEIVPEHHKHLIMALQNIHDKKDSELWEEELEKLTKKYNLIYEN